jgi:hypothetical protein
MTDRLIVRPGYMSQHEFQSKWFSDIHNASGGEFYSHLKKYILESYLLRLKRGFKTVICKLRTCSINLYHQ